MLCRPSLIAALSALAFLFVAAPAAAAPAVSGEFELKTGIDNSKLVAGPDGNIWVTLQGPAEDVASVTPAGVVTEFDLAVAGTLGIANGPDGKLWATRPGGLTRFDAGNPEATKTAFEISAIEDNSPIVAGPDGRLWVATKDKLLAVNLADPTEPQVVSLPGLSPKDIDVAGSLIVVAGFEHILAFDIAGAKVGDQKVSGQAQGVAGNPNGQYAFTQPVSPPKEIGLLAPGGAPIIRSAEGTDPFGITLGADGAYWAPEFISDGLTRITADGTISGLTGFAKNSGPRQIAAGPGNTLWVALEATDRIGRVSGLEAPVSPPPPPTAPRTRITAGPKGKLTTKKNFRPVRFGFKSPDLATAFECRLRKLGAKGKAKATGKGAKGSAKKKPVKFKPCSSPKGYKVKPGRYRFEVRAVNQGTPDPTPAKRSFRVVRIGR